MRSLCFVLVHFTSMLDMQHGQGDRCHPLWQMSPALLQKTREQLRKDIEGLCALEGIVERTSTVRDLFGRSILAPWEDEEFSAICAGYESAIQRHEGLVRVIDRIMVLRWEEEWRGL